MSLNAKYFTNLTDQINAVNGCAELQILVDEAFKPIQDLNASLTAELAQLAPILALLTAPTSPTAVITWVGDFITHVLTPMYQPYLTMTTQVTELITAVADLTTAIENAASRITSCSITIPPI